MLSAIRQETMIIQWFCKSRYNEVNSENLAGELARDIK